MNPIRKLNTNEGVVLITVVIVVIVIMILAVSLVSMTVGQSISNQHQVERIQAEQLAKGSMWYNFMNLYPGGPAAVPPGPITLDGRTFNPSFTVGAPGGGPNQTTPYAITVDCISGCQ